MNIARRPESGAARVLVVGGGAREHALVWSLARSPQVGALYCAPGNPGIAALATLLPISVDDVAALTAATVDLEIDLVVIGPEGPLVAGLVDALTGRGVAAVGPTAAAAALEGSKAFGKEIMSAAGVSTAAYRVFDDADDAERYLARAALPLVVKADGLAAGKGVTVCATRAEAMRAVDEAMRRRLFGPAGDRVVIEACLVGEEVSVLAVTDGETVRMLLPVQDHKRLLEGDQGPNTGGMGVVAPSTVLTTAELATVQSTILEPVLAVLAERGLRYRGIIYAGLMRSAGDLAVLEFNCRLGDPEAQVLLPLLEDDLYTLLEATTCGALSRAPLHWRPAAAVGVTVAAPGYPTAPVVGMPIELPTSLPDTVLLFHGGTATDPTGRLVVAGGRVLTAVGLGATVAAARAAVLPPPVWFEGMQFRRDIGARAVEQAGHAAGARAGYGDE